MSSCEKTSAAVADLLQGGIYYTEKTLGSQESTVKASMKSAIIPFIIKVLQLSWQQFSITLTAGSLVNIMRVSFIM